MNQRNNYIAEDSEDDPLSWWWGYIRREAELRCPQQWYVPGEERSASGDVCNVLLF